MAKTLYNNIKMLVYVFDPVIQALILQTSQNGDRLEF